MTTMYTYCIKEYLNENIQFDLYEDTLIDQETGEFLETLNNGSMSSDIPYIFRNMETLPRAECYYERTGVSETMKKYMDDLEKKNPYSKIYYYTGEKLKQLIDVLSKEYYSKDIFKFRYQEELEHPTPEGETMKIPTEEEYEILERIINNLNYLYLTALNTYNIETARFIFYSYDN